MVINLERGEMVNKQVKKWREMLINKLRKEEKW